MLCYPLRVARRAAAEPATVQGHDSEHVRDVRKSTRLCRSKRAQSSSLKLQSRTQKNIRKRTKQNKPMRRSTDRHVCCTPSRHVVEHGQHAVQALGCIDVRMARYKTDAIKRDIRVTIVTFSNVSCVDAAETRVCASFQGRSHLRREVLKSQATQTQGS